jgi:hypothetical protein
MGQDRGAAAGSHLNVTKGPPRGDGDTAWGVARRATTLPPQRAGSSPNLVAEGLLGGKARPIPWRGLTPRPKRA